MAVLQSFNIALEKEGEKKKKYYYNTGYSYVVLYSCIVLGRVVQSPIKLTQG